MGSDLLYVFSGSFILSFVIMELISPRLWRNSNAYNSLTADQKLEWNSRTLSSLHAAVSTSRSLYTVVTNNDSNYVWSDDRFAFHTIAITAGYIVADLLMLMVYREKIGGTIGIVVHHLITIQAYMQCLTKEYLVYFANFKLLAEASTVFLNIRWLLVACNRKDSPWYFYNGLMLTTAFFLSRILLAPLFYIFVYRTIYTSVYNQALTLVEHYSWTSVSLLLDFLNIVWFRRLVSGALKYLDDAPPPSATTTTTHHSALTPNHPHHQVDGAGDAPALRKR